MPTMQALKKTFGKRNCNESVFSFQDTILNRVKPDPIQSPAKRV